MLQDQPKTIPVTSAGCLVFPFLDVCKQSYPFSLVNCYMSINASTMFTSVRHVS